MQYGTGSSSPLRASFCCLWTTLAWFGTTLRSIWFPLGSMWFCLVSTWLALPNRGAPVSLWDALGCRGPSGIFYISVKIGSPIPSKCISSTVPAHKVLPARTLPAIPRIPRQPKWHMAHSSQPPSLAPGARMTLVKHIPTNHVYIYIYIFSNIRE